MQTGFDIHHDIQTEHFIRERKIGGNLKSAYDRKQ